MREQPIILALDLATRFGWCEGQIGGVMSYGSQRCASEGSGPGAIFGGMIKWLVERIQVVRPNIVAFEAPLPPSFNRGKTNVKTTRILMGLAAITEGVCDRSGIFTVL